VGALLRRFRLNASVVWRRRGPKIFRRDARRRANVGRRKRERNRTPRFRRRNVDAWRNATSECFLGLGTAENRALQNRRRETPKFFWLFEKRRKRRRFGRCASASKKSSDFRLQRTETTQTTAVRTLRFGLKEKSGLPLATNGNDANDGGSDAAFRPQRRVRTSACDERKRRPASEETHAPLRKGVGAS
jgi:hypothetical protein